MFFHNLALKLLVPILLAALKTQFCNLWCFCNWCFHHLIRLFSCCWQLLMVDGNGILHPRGKCALYRNILQSHALFIYLSDWWFFLFFELSFNVRSHVFCCCTVITKHFRIHRMAGCCFNFFSVCYIEYSNWCLM